MLNQIEYRIQSLFERLVGMPSASLNRPAMTHIAPRHLPDNLHRPACWRRSKRVNAVLQELQESAEQPGALRAQSGRLVIND
ncbi:MAG: hypothetical protein H6943_00450 [Zoogloeaceae bacterium]|nr:hypothetical protein [Zoogloeaceae bacterium]